jgi:hypothetical protein
MKQDLALKVLGEILGWTQEECLREFAWLELMSRYKYDDYSDYIAGARFIESLVDWLQQFKVDERAAAYAFVRSSLIFFSAAEIQHLVELVYLETVRPQLLKTVAAQFGIPAYLVWSHPDAKATYSCFLRKSLFLGLSDGARIDAFRRANTGIISNEQVVLATEIGEQKWDSLLKDLRADLNDPSATFSSIFLLDDFVGSGKTLIRQGANGQTWEGRLPKFWTIIQNRVQSHFAPNYRVYVHHYVATSSASQSVPERFEAAKRSHEGTTWLPNIKFTFGLILPPTVCVTAQTHPEFMRLIQVYYDPSIETKHTAVGGGNDVRMGFGQCALPLIMEHNTPNNSVALLWAETRGESGHAMRPLFRRRQRHTNLEGAE